MTYLAGRWETAGQAKWQWDRCSSIKEMRQFWKPRQASGSLNSSFGAADNSGAMQL